MTIEKWIVGPEHDELLLKQLGVTLKGMGFDLGGKWEGVAGSQDISHWELISPAGVLIVESETYMGLTVEGPIALVRQIRRQFEGAIS